MSLRSAGRHLCIMAAGTGGHVMPGLAVARQMQHRGWTVSWIGTESGMENRLVPPSGIEIDRIAFSGLRGKGLWAAFKGLWALAISVVQCGRILKRRRADAVLGMGGYVCLPGGLASAILRKPLLLVNADADWLLSNRALAPLAQRVLFGFEGSAAASCRQGEVLGNPVRTELEALSAPTQRYAQRKGPMKLLVMGGSLGAKVLNETVPQALALLPPEQRPQVLHQSGTAHAESVAARYQSLGLKAEVRPFIEDMAQALSECDVALCRAGAITVSELCAAGVPAVLVPLVLGTTAHQRGNAQWMADQGAAIHLPQSELSPTVLARQLQGLSRELLLTMAQKAHALARPGAAQRVAEHIEACERARRGPKHIQGESA
jgi:UDP-N-acetylglucosamine--N-acetylmuramyl-(pentapeptide) pyrophosphoryl-undecaprenol N-acetylglucosamine transferase